MNIINKAFRAINILKIRLKVCYYNLISDFKISGSKPEIIQPQFRRGRGKFICGENVKMGISKTPGFFDGLTYLDLRSEKSVLIIEDGVQINNNFWVTCAGTSITIKKNSLIGLNVQLIDADFHSLNPNKRRDKTYSKKPILIDENSWIGNNVTVLKGVHIGMNSVIAANSVVTKSIPPNCLAAGNPAKVIKSIIS